jgi:transcriptional regulator with XRE-family HTH domain
MPNLPFERYLAEFLNEARASNGKKLTYKEIAEKSALSRTTLYNWVSNSGIAKDDHVRKLAQGLTKIDVNLAEEAGTAPRLPGEDPVYQRLLSLLTDPIDTDPGDAAYRFVPYLPINGCPSDVANGLRRESPDWSFLGNVVSNFLAATDQRKTTYQTANIGHLTHVGVRDVLVGFFATPDRYREWDFIKTPIQIPLNAVVFQEDADLFMRQILKNRRPDIPRSDVVEYVKKTLADILWRPESFSGHAAEDIQPILGVDEVGWRYAQDVLGFVDAEIEKFSIANGSLDAHAFEAQLNTASTAFREQVQAGLSPRLPVVIVDEFTAIQIRRNLQARGALLVSDLLVDTIHPSVVTRPRYIVGIAFKRDPGRAEPSPVYIETKRMFEDFLWTNTSMVARSYLALYKKLIQSFGDLVIHGYAPLYFLRWLSLNVTEADIGQPDRYDASDAEFADIPDLGPWRGILRTAKALILKDPDCATRLSELIRRRGDALVHDCDASQRAGDVK